MPGFDSRVLFLVLPFLRVLRVLCVVCGWRWNWSWDWRLALHLGKFGAHGCDGSLVVLGAEDRRAGDESVRSGAGNLGNVVHFHSAVHFEPDIAPGIPDAFAHCPQFGES